MSLLSNGEDEISHSDVDDVIYSSGDDDFDPNYMQGIITEKNEISSFVDSPEKTENVENERIVIEEVKSACFGDLPRDRLLQQSHDFNSKLQDVERQEKELQESLKTVDTKMRRRLESANNIISEENNDSSTHKSNINKLQIPNDPFNPISSDRNNHKDNIHNNTEHFRKWSFSPNEEGAIASSKKKARLPEPEFTTMLTKSTACIKDLSLSNYRLPRISEYFKELNSQRIGTPSITIRTYRNGWFHS